MIDVNNIIEVQKNLINKFGGSHGTRDINGLLSAINRPFQTFDSIDLYPTNIEKAAAITQSLVINHPFIDGNKRIGYFMCIYFIEQDNLKLTCNKESKRDFIIQIAEGKLDYDAIVDWLKNNTVSI